MSIENPVDQTIVDVSFEDDTDLDSFTESFFGQSDDDPTEAKPEVAEETVEEVDAPEIEDEADADSDDTHEETDEVEEEPAEAKEKPKKNRFQERVDDLTGKYREQERRANALEARLQEALEKIEASAPKATASSNGEPTPTDLNEDGSERYPLGEFDAGYIRDLTRFTLKQEQDAYEAKTKQQQEQQLRQAEAAKLNNEWNQKVSPALERYPDFIERSQSLLDDLGDLDDSYSEYLADTLKSMEFGPDVLYYLASNPDEARQIVNAGKGKAAISLGRIEAKFAYADAEKKVARQKVTKAPTPPPTNKGNLQAHVEVPDDTDDLDAFMTKLYPKSGRR